MRVLMIGRQGAGKGTQASRLSEDTGLPWVSTGEMFREAAAEGTKLGTMAQSYMTEGQLVPDDVTIGLVKERLAKPDAVTGVILDGFPRTRLQAEALDRMLGGQAIDLVINIDVPEDVCRQRLLHRARTEGRDDDTPEAIDERLAVYQEQTQPLLAYYGAKVSTVDGLGSIDEVFDRCLAQVKAAPRG